MKLLVVDDHILFRQGLVSMLQQHSNYEIIGEAGSVKQAVEQARVLKPDLILMDYMLGDGTGLEAAQMILNELPLCKIVFLTVADEDEILFRALRSHASGYILKDVTVEDLLKSLKRLEHGEIAISNEMVTKVINEFIKTSPPDNHLAFQPTKLSRRELEVLHALANGASNQEIAQTLFISENTVKHHVHNILKKLGLHDRREAANYAREHGLIS